MAELQRIFEADPVEQGHRGTHQGEWEDDMRYPYERDT